MLANAMEKSGSTDPVAVAKALEGMEFTTLNGDKLTMRAEDHQAIQPIRISVHTDENVTFDADNSGYGLVTESVVTAEDSALPSTCKMERPS